MITIDIALKPLFLQDFINRFSFIVTCSQFVNDQLF